MNMKNFLLKENFAIVLALVLPVAFIVIIALITYLPSLFLSTNYDFVYAICRDSLHYIYPERCENYIRRRYAVVKNKLVVNNNVIDLTRDSDRDGIPDIEDYEVRFFLHNTEKNESREITFAEAQTLKLSNLSTSPDGVAVSFLYRNGGIFFFDFGDSSYGYYLTKGKLKRRLNLIEQDNPYSYRDTFHFIGWVLPKGDESF